MRTNMSRAISVFILVALSSRVVSANGDDSCQDLQVSQSYCLESYSRCADKPCEPIQLPDDASCLQANYLLCKYNIPDCCCGQHMIDAVECRIPNCKIECESLVQASSAEECTSEAMVLSSCLNSLDSGIHDCKNQKCPDASSLNIQPDTTCTEMTEQICSADIPKCCCREELIQNAECSFMKVHGIECNVKCAVDQEEAVPTGSEEDNTNNSPSDNYSGTVSASTESDESASSISRTHRTSTFVVAAVYLLCKLV